MRVNLVQESARHLEMTRARQMRVDTRDLAEAIISATQSVHPFILLKCWTVMMQRNIFLICKST